MAGEELAPLNLTVNGALREVHGPADRSLIGVLRHDLALPGTKPGCGEGQCGACTVLLDGEPVFACQTSVGEAAGRSVTTIEGLASGDGGGLHPVQRAIVAERAAQCGYCTPAMALRAAALLAGEPDPDERRIAEAMAPNLCRCGCYPRLVRAVRRAAAIARDAGVAEAPEELAEGAPAPFEPWAVWPRPRRPWDLCEPEEREWFELLGDGVVVVWPPPEGDSASWTTRGGAWLHLAPDGTVTAFSGKADVGQDNRTAFRLLVAEELRVNPDRVRVVLGDTDLCPHDMGTFGSRSMPDAGEALRRTAAGARELLAAVGPERWASVGERRVEVLGGEPSLTHPSAWRVAGTTGWRPGRVDAVTGSRRFSSDVDRPGLLHGAVLRPSVRGAELIGLDASGATGRPGVTIVREDDLVGAVAPDPATARQAVAELAARAEWSEPPPGPDDVAGYLRAHTTAGEGRMPGLDESAGDVDAALSRSGHLVEATYTTAYIAHTPLETRAAVAEWESERLTVWTGTQNPFRFRSEVAASLGVGEDAVRVVVVGTGGAFGGKHTAEVAVEAARLARAVGAPVKVHWSRAEEIRFGYSRPMAVIDVRAGAEDGAISAWDFLNLSAGPAGIGLPYAVVDRRIRFQPAESPLPRGSYRALAATANHFARECAVDELAHAAGVGQLEFRLANLRDERLADVLRAAAGRFGWPGPGQAAAPSGGCGLAVGLEKGGRVATCAEVVVETDETLAVLRIVTAYECGAVVNPDTVVNQIEGATVMALGGALFEQVPIARGSISEATLHGYRLPRFTDCPTIEVVLLDRRDLPSAGAGETPLVAVAPAIANAVFAATGRRLRSLPLTPGGRLPPAAG